MHVNPGLISVVFIALTALIAGMLFTKIRQPALVGYILTGLVLGQSGFGLIQSRESISFLAELGMLLLLFFVGMQLSLRGFRGVWLVATLTTGLQLVAALAVMWLISGIIGWSIATAVLFGFVAAVSSTAVAIKMLQDLNILQTQVGQLSVSILIAQDLAIVPILLVIGALAGEGFQITSMINVVLSVLFLALLVWYLSRRTKVRLPFSGFLARSTELQPLFGLVICFGSAFLTAMLGLTTAYGAFLAGLIVGNSSVRRIIQRSVQPVQSILIMMFFVSVGLLIDLEFVWHNIGLVVLITFIVTVVKTVLNIGILTLLREPWPHAFISGVMLAQIGEFSFLLGGVGRSLGIIRPEEFQLIVTVAAFSLIISARRLLRIALTGTVSAREVFIQIKTGGARAFWRATRSREMPLPLALRILGRPKRSSPPHHSGDD